MTSSNGKIFRVTGPLCGEFTGPGEFPTQRPVTRSFDVFFDLRLNKRLSKHSWGWWFETLSWSLWRHHNENGRYFAEDILIKISLKFIPTASIDNNQVLVQVIIWTNADPIHWRIYAALGGDELIGYPYSPSSSHRRLQLCIDWQRSSWRSWRCWKPSQTCSCHNCSWRDHNQECNHQAWTHHSYCWRYI